MNEKFNKNMKVEQLTKMLLSCEEEKGLIAKDPLPCECNREHILECILIKCGTDVAYYECINSKS